MSEVPVKIFLSRHTRGDRWVGVPLIGPVLINNATPSATLARVRMQFESATGDTYTLDSEAGADGSISIDNATTGEASIPETDDFLATAGQWAWDMEFYQTGHTSPLTLYRGVLTVRDDVG